MTNLLTTFNVGSDIKYKCSNDHPLGITADLSNLINIYDKMNHGNLNLLYSLWYYHHASPSVIGAFSYSILNQNYDV